MHIHENAYLQLRLDPQRACWGITPALSHDLALEGAQMRVAYRCGRRRLIALDRWEDVQIGEARTISSVHGALRQVEIQVGPDACGLRISVEFALAEGAPALLWRLGIENCGPQPVHLERLTLLEIEAAGEGDPGRIANLSPAEAGFFSNGWQTWSYAGAYHPQDRFRRTRLGPIRAPTDVNAGTPQPKRAGHFASDMFGVLGDRGSRRALLAGFLSQEQHFGSLEARLGADRTTLSLWANGDGARMDPGAQIETDWAGLFWLDIDDPDPLGPYLEAVKRQAGLADPSKAAIPSGWCSWYQFSSETYEGAVTAQDIRDNLQALKRLRDDLPLSIVQIDDGFEAQIGDWFSFRSGFPQGVAPLAAEIRQAGLTPGLWLAPFVVHPRSRLATGYPDLLLRGRLNRPVNAGFGWDAFATALDLTHPAALEYARSVVETAVHNWGFTYLKLDFLYAAALPGKYRDPTCTRAQVLRAGLAALRQAAGREAFLLGCACPLGPAIGLVDAMRVSADTARRWKPSYRGVETFIAAEPNLPAARNACHNSLTRAPLHNRWWINDPDCLLTRPDTHLSLAEVQTVATVIALSGGSVFASDHLPELPEERLRILRALLPPIGKRPRLLDWLDEPTPRRVRLDLEDAAGPKHLLALFNWEDTPQDLTVSLGEFGFDPQAAYWGREFWRGETRLLSEEGWSFPACPAHGVILLAVRRRMADRPQYLGSDLHISQGSEVERWCWEPASGELAFRLARPGRASGVIDLALPGAIQSASLNGAPLVWRGQRDGVYRLWVEFENEAEVNIRLLQDPA